MALRPELPDQPVRLRRSTPTTRRSAARAAPARRGDTCPTPPGRDHRRLRRQRPAVAAPTADRRRRRRPSRSLIDGLVPAVPEPLGRRHRSSAPTARSTSAAGDGASFNFADYGQTGTPTNPCGDPPVPPAATRRRPTPRAARCAARTSGPTGDPRALDGRHPHRPRRPARPARQPAQRRAAIRTRSRIIAYGLRNPFRFTFRPGTNELWVGDVGWNTLGGDQPHRRRRPAHGRELRLAVLRGQRARRPATTAPTCSLCESLYSASTARSPLLHATRTRGRSSPGEACPTGSSSISGLAFYAGRQLPGRVPGRAVLRRLLAQLHLGDARGANGLPDPATRRARSRRRGRAGRPRDRPRTATCSTPTSTTARSAASTTSPATSRRRRGRSRHPDVGRGAADGAVRRRRLERPESGDTLTYAWDLDGDGEFDDATDLDAQFTYTGRHATPPACG